MENEKNLKRFELKDDEIEEINGGSWTNSAEASRALASVCKICERYGSYSREGMRAQEVYILLNNDQGQHTFDEFRRMMEVLTVDDGI